MKTTKTKSKTIDLSGLTPAILPGLAARLNRDFSGARIAKPPLESGDWIDVKLKPPGSQYSIGQVIFYLDDPDDSGSAWITVGLDGDGWYHAFDGEGNPGLPVVELSRVPLAPGRRMGNGIPNYYEVSVEFTPAFEALYEETLRSLARAIAAELANPTPVVAPESPKPEVTMPTPAQISLYFKAQSAKAAAKMRGTPAAKARARKAGRAKKRKRRGVRPANALVKGSEEARRWAERMRAAQAAKAEARRAAVNL
jgi:hypothetical protein